MSESKTESGGLTLHLTESDLIMLQYAMGMVHGIAFSNPKNIVAQQICLGTLPLCRSMGIEIPSGIFSEKGSE